MILESITTLIIGLLGGASVGLQSPISGLMGQRIGGLAASFVIHVSGAIFSGLLLFTQRGENIREWRTLPWYMLIAGIFGVILYLTLNHTMPRIGPGVAVTLLIVGQLLMGVLIDQFGWFGVPVRPLDISRLLGVVLLLVGGYLLSRQTGAV